MLTREACQKQYQTFLDNEPLNPNALISPIAQTGKMLRTHSVNEILKKVKWLRKASNNPTFWASVASVVWQVALTDHESGYARYVEYHTTNLRGFGYILETVIDNGRLYFCILTLDNRQIKAEAIEVQPAYNVNRPKAVILTSFGKSEIFYSHGPGAYPYECISKDNYPNDEIFYRHDQHGAGTWFGRRTVDHDGMGRYKFHWRTG